MYYDREKVNFYRQQFPKGTKIELISMNDPYREMPAGLKGIVDHVDDACQIHCDWENGSGLALIPGVDKFRAVKEQEQTAENNHINGREPAIEAEDEEDMEL